MWNPNQTPFATIPAALAAAFLKTYHGDMDGTRYYFMEKPGLELVRSRPGRRVYPWHMHAGHWTIGLMLEGAIRLHVCQGLPARFGPGSTFVLAPCQGHSLETDADTELAVLCLETPLEPGPHAQALAHLCRSAGLPSRAGDRLGALGHEQSLTAHAPWPLPDDVMTIIRRTLLAPDEPSSLTVLAGCAGYSRWHFLRRFQAATGMTPRAFVRHCRVRRARTMLRADMAAACAAAAAGFSDQSHMHRLFRLYHGLTPKGFRLASIRIPF
jgi:AraC-type DNA-binding domain-containing proteins